MTERRAGTRRLYRADPATMAELRAFLDDYWSSGLERLRDVAEADESPPEAREADPDGRAGTSTGSPSPRTGGENDRDDPDEPEESR